MKLYVDIGPLLEDQWTGIPVFTRRLILALLQAKDLDLRFSYRFTEVPRAAIVNTLSLGTGTYLRAQMELNGVQDLAIIDRSLPMLYPSVKPRSEVSGREAATVHDISTLVMPETHERANIVHHLGNLRHELASSERVFCVSEASRAALELAFPSVASRLDVLYQYVDWDAEFQHLDDNLAPPAFGDYALCVGTIEPRKNLGLLLRALETEAVRKSGLKFIVIGRRGWKVDDALRGLSPDAQELISFTGFVSEFLKYRLLRHCRFLVFPSLYEGFGIPAVEAMSLGRPVLASFTSSFPEVIGDAGVYFDPMSLDGFLAALGEILHPKRHGELAQRTRAQAATFSGARMAAPVISWLGQHG